MLAVTRSASDAWLGEVHDLEHVLAVFLCVAHSEVEPLLMAACVGVDLHVKAVLMRSNSVSTK